MIHSFETYYLNHLGTLLNSKRIPLNSRQRKSKKGIYPYYGASGIIDYIDDFLFEGEHVLISEDGENLRTRQTPIAFKADGKFWVNNHAHIFKGKENWINNFVVYYLKGMDLNPFITGAVQPKLNKENLLSVPIMYPGDINAKIIASILSSLDNKIELNLRINKTLEAIAQRIFKEWFVDYRFPGFNGDLMDGLPKGWREGSIYELIDVIYGYPFKSTLFNSQNRGKGLIRIRDLKNNNTGFYTIEITNENYKIRPGDVLAGMDAEFIPSIWLGEEAWLNQRVCKFKPKYEYVNEMFVLFAIQPLLERSQYGKVGTTVIHLGKSDIDMYEIVIPTKEVLISVFPIFRSIHQRIIGIENENRLLSQLRDILLPKLMSGKIRVA